MSYKPDKHSFCNIIAEKVLLCQGFAEQNTAIRFHTALQIDIANRGTS